MKSYTVVISRLQQYTTCIEVQAENGKDAETQALEQCDKCTFIPSGKAFHEVVESCEAGILGRTYKDGTLCNGSHLSRTYYPSGALLLEIPVVQGERHGVSRSYFESGELLAEWVYEHDKLTTSVSYFKAA